MEVPIFTLLGSYLAWSNALLFGIAFRLTGRFVFNLFSSYFTLKWDKYHKVFPLLNAKWIHWLTLLYKKTPETAIIIPQMLDVVTWFCSKRRDTLMIATRFVTFATAYVRGATSFSNVNARIFWSQCKSPSTIKRISTFMVSWKINKITLQPKEKKPNIIIEIFLAFEGLPH